MISTNTDLALLNLRVLNEGDDKPIIIVETSVYELIAGFNNRIIIFDTDYKNDNNKERRSILNNTIKNTSNAVLPYTCTEYTDSLDFIKCIYDYITHAKGRGYGIIINSLKTLGALSLYLEIAANTNKETALEASNIITKIFKELEEFRSMTGLADALNIKLRYKGDNVFEYLHTFLEFKDFIDDLKLKTGVSVDIDIHVNDIKNIKPETMVNYNAICVGDNNIAHIIFVENNKVKDVTKGATINIEELVANIVAGLSYNIVTDRFSLKRIYETYIDKVLLDNGKLSGFETMGKFLSNVTIVENIHGDFKTALEIHEAYIKSQKPFTNTYVLKANSAKLENKIFKLLRYEEFNIPMYNIYTPLTFCENNKDINCMYLDKSLTSVVNEDTLYGFIDAVRERKKSGLIASDFSLYAETQLGFFVDILK